MCPPVAAVALYSQNHTRHHHNDVEKVGGNLGVNFALEVWEFMLSSAAA
jgi:hypothetical protein